MKVLLGIACLLLIACTPRAPTVAIPDARTRAPAVAIRAVTVVDVMDGSLRGQTDRSCSGQSHHGRRPGRPGPDTPRCGVG